MMLKILFQAGAYSQNKEDIKKVFALLDYKYKSGIQRNDKLICIWKRDLSNQIIKGIFNGSGKPCEFIVDCNDDEQTIFKSFEIAYKARVSIHNENPGNTRQLLEEATKRINKWFTWQKPYKNEPELFYQKRLEKMKESYQWFINKELERLKQSVAIT
jgi:hypothetical protein